MTSAQERVGWGGGGTQKADKRKGGCVIVQKSGGKICRCHLRVAPNGTDAEKVKERKTRKEGRRGDGKEARKRNDECKQC